MKKLILLLLVLPVLSFGQEKNTAFKKWSAIGSAGLVVGQSGNRPVFQLSSGINYQQFFTGMGLGYDSYEFNSIPVFADWRFKFGKRQIGFIYGLAGYNFPVKNKEVFESSKTSESVRGGVYFDAGLGCRIPVGKVNRLLLSTGFSQKDIRQRKTFVYPCFTGDCPENIYNRNYSFGRLTAKLSWELGY